MGRHGGEVGEEGMVLVATCLHVGCYSFLDRWEVREDGGPKTHELCPPTAGLDVNSHTILEMACAITDSELNIVAEVRNSLNLPM